MEGFVGLLIVLGIGLFAAGPVAVVMAIVLFNKLGSINRRLNKMEGKDEYGPLGVVPARPIEPAAPTALVPPTQKPPVEPQRPSQAISQPTPTVVSKPPEASKTMAEVAAAIKEFVPLKPKPATEGGLELKIGTTVALIVGVITVIVGVGFFLKYVYDNMTFSEEARVCMVAVGGLVAIVVGEVLRRRNYEIVAKGIAALGFALLYAAVFSGSRVYALFSTEWAFGLSIAITAGAMTYAVALDEVIIAFLALLGGYLSPVIISTGQNLPVPLFSYVFVLSAGAMGSAMFRRWRAVNWIAMVGTYLLYTGWFEKFYTPDQMQIALFWLGVFGSMYLILPILNGLIRQTQSLAEDVGLVVINSAAVFYYLWRILQQDFQHEFALTCAGLGAVHLGMMAVGRIRCREDSNLQAALGVLGTAFVTVAVPLYFSRTQPMLIAWSIEAIALTFIGIRYQNLWTKAMSILVAVIASAGLFYHLPLHDSGDFRMILNEPFGTWVFVALAIMLCHAIWRFMRSGQDEERALMAQVYYVWGRLLLATGLAMEWYAHCDWHIEYLRQGQGWFLMGMMVIAAILSIGFFARPICPKGQFVQAVGAVTTACGAIFTAIAMTEIYYDEFMIFVNWPFLIAAAFVLVTLAGAWFVRRTDEDAEGWFRLSAAMVLGALLLVWLLLSEQIYQYFWCQNKYVETLDNWRRLSQMYMSVAWAVYAAVLIVIGFITRTAGIRYLSLLIFAVLLGKINLDIWHLGTEYRIATFLTTGLILVGVSLLYQFLKNKGFFDTMEKQIANVNDQN
ncbi:MAG: DUF2339 domain-containing protein [Planctomycetota bacterium]|jgi:uncharacterized membrane protein